MIRALTKILEFLLTLLMAAMILDVVWQVFTRYILQHPSSYTEELATFLLVWIGLMGAAYAYRKQAHLGVDILTMKFRGAARKGVEVFIHSCIALFGLLALVWGGSRLVQVMLRYDQISPALGLKMGHVYLILPLSGAFILIFALDFIRSTWLGAGELGRESLEKLKGPAQLS